MVKLPWLSDQNESEMNDLYWLTSLHVNHNALLRVLMAVDRLMPLDILMITRKHNEILNVPDKFILRGYRSLGQKFKDISFFMIEEFENQLI